MFILFHKVIYYKIFTYLEKGVQKYEVKTIDNPTF